MAHVVGFNGPTTHPERLALVAWGCVTPLGENALESALGFRVGASPLGQCALVDDQGEVPAMSTIPTLDPHVEGAARLTPLVLTSISQALTPIAHLIAGRSISTHFLADEPHPELPIDHGSETLALLARDHVRQLTATAARVELHTTGAAGLASIFERIAADFRAGAAELALISAAHTDYVRPWIQFLSRHRRLHTPEQLDGMMLSELAGAILVCPPATARALGLSATLHVDAWKSTIEKALWSNDESAYEAAALTVAARAVTERHHQSHRNVGWVSSDASLESFRMAELQSLIIRLQSRLGPPQQLDTPGHRLGHLGSAAGVWQLIYAAEAHLRKFAACEETLCLLGSENGARAALLLDARSA